MIEKVARLLRAHEGDQGPVEFKPSTWQPLLSRWPAAAQVLTDDRYSIDLANGRRTVQRSGLRAIINATDVTEPIQVIRAFTLITVWGSGVRSRSYRNLPRALAAPDCAEQLSAAALTCRAGDFAAAYVCMRLPGIGPAFFTKWFAFAGSTEDAPCRPLILDARVWRTLNSTLGISRNDLGRRVSPAKRYVAYTELLHGWADDLCRHGVAVDAERLEFTLFAHNGHPLPGGELGAAEAVDLVATQPQFTVLGDHLSVPTESAPPVSLA